MIWKIQKKGKWNSDKIWTIGKKIVQYGKYGRKVSWIVKRYGKYEWKVSWVVKRYGNYERKASWIVKWYGKYGKVSLMLKRYG